MGKLDKLKSIKPKGQSGLDVVNGAKKSFQDTEDYIKKNIQIHPDFQKYIDPLDLKEFDQLEENILDEGCRDPLVLWKLPDSDTHYLIDGHNRHQICTKHGVNFKINVKHFENAAEAQDWMLKNQLGRRNLTKEQMARYRGQRYNNLKTNPTDNLKKGSMKGKQKSVDAANLLADEYGTSRAGIIRDGNYAKGLENIQEVNPDLQQKILKGKSGVKRTEVEGLTKLDGEQQTRAIKSIEKKANQPKSNANPKSSKKSQPKATHVKGEHIALQDIPSYLREMKQLHENQLKQNNGDAQHFKSEGIVELCEHLLSRIK